MTAGPIILHCGPQKTGSTYLQACFFKDRDALAKAHIHYISDTKPGMKVRRLGSGIAAMVRDQRVDSVHEFTAALPASGNILLSDELIASQSRDKVLHFAAACEPRPILPIFYFRRWSDRLFSLWGQKVIEGHTATFAHWFNRRRQRTSDEAANDAVMWENFRLPGAGSRLRICSFDALRHARRDLYTDFCESFLDQSRQPPSSANALISPSPIEIEIVRAMAVLAAAQGQELQLRKRLHAGGPRWLRAMRAQNFLPFAELMAPYRQTVVVDDTDDAFAAWRRDIASFKQHFVLPPGYDLLLPGRRECEVYDPRWADAPQAHAKLSFGVRRILGEQKRRLARRAARGRAGEAGPS